MGHPEWNETSAGTTLAACCNSAVKRNPDRTVRSNNMQLGFMSAILPDHTLEEVFALGKATGYTCVELMCWPPGKADRRYAGVTHIDVSNFDGADASRVLGLAEANGMEISGLGYYPNLLSPDLEEGRVAASHLRRVISAAKMLEPRGREHVCRTRLDPVGRRELASLPICLEGSGLLRRRPGSSYRHRELPYALYRRRMARGQESGVQSCDLAAHVRGDPQPQLRAQLRSVASWCGSKWTISRR